MRRRKAQRLMQSRMKLRAGDIARDVRQDANRWGGGPGRIGRHVPSRSGGRSVSGVVEGGQEVEWYWLRLDRQPVLGHAIPQRVVARKDRRRVKKRVHAAVQAASECIQDANYYSVRVEVVAGPVEQISVGESSIASAHELLQVVRLARGARAPARRGPGSQGSDLLAQSSPVWAGHRALSPCWVPRAEQRSWPVVGPG